MHDFRHSDGDIERAVQKRLAGDPRVEAGAIRVRVKDGIVTLAGKVQTARARLAAHEDAWAPDGVRSVQDELQLE